MLWREKKSERKKYRASYEMKGTPGNDQVQHPVIIECQEKNTDKKKP